jgi:hypothetical protein
MSSAVNIIPATDARRYSQPPRVKFAGATYTPLDFANFVADQIAANLPKFEKAESIRLLDPAVGDGSLLLAMISRIPIALHKRLQVVGFDTNPLAVASSLSRLNAAYPDIQFKVEERDFLNYVLTMSSGIFADRSNQFDIVIANPPYVRTQILGAKQAQLLSKQFGLSGRVDLYFPFLLGISEVMSDSGLAGIIVSNRFMSTKSGQPVRRELLSRFRFLHVWDMGDTKLFEAAVLPAVLLGQKENLGGKSTERAIPFSTIYEEKIVPPSSQAKNPLDALHLDSGIVAAVPDGRRFKVAHGVLDNGGCLDGVWRIATGVSDTWLATVTAHTWATFARIGKIRVGVKTTADSVFIRSDWENVSCGQIPELLRPLTTRKCGRHFKPIQPEHPKQILYPHEMGASGRAAVDLSKFPNSARYLESHRKSLEARTYVIEAGRQWYELWVPQSPSAWAEAKLVFPDISEKPMFWIDIEGTVVNGDCYWLRCEGDANPDWLWLALAVANSTFIEAFYDHRFNNKLYAGRRRFITQYVEQFPLPDPTTAESKSIIEFTKYIYNMTPSAQVESLRKELDLMVWRVFGLEL